MFHPLRPVVCALLVSLMACALFPLLPACAQGPSSSSTGTYTWTGTDPTTGKPIQSPTFSGGQWYDLYYQPSGPFDYESSGSSTGTGDSSGQYNSVGTVKAVFTWQAASNLTSITDPAPSCILTQMSDANWYASDFSSKPTTICTDGLAQPADPEYDYSSGGTFQGRSSGTRYSAGVPTSGAVSVTLTGAQAMIDLTNGGQYPDVDSSVSWTVTASPVTISLSGTLTDNNGNPILDSNGNQQILVGQRCTANLVGIPSISGATISYVWTVAGNRVENYVVSSDQTTGTTTAFTPPNAASAYWYWSDKATSESVACKATITPPAGEGSQFSVTATKTVSLQAPTPSIVPIPGAVQLNDANSATYNAPYALYVGPADATQQHGITWQGNVNTPTIFTTQGAGTWQFTQLITPVLSRTVPKGTPQPSSNNGKSGLDTVDPYGSATYPADNSQHSNGDNPGFGVQDTCSNYTVSETFQTYVMYQPPTAPGSAAILVPLYEIDWNWGANVNSVNGSWANFGNSSLGGQLTITSKQAQTQHPSWKMLVASPPVW